MLCAFCPKDAVEIGGEHIWDSWLNKALPPLRYRSRKRYTIDSPVIESEAVSLEEKLPVVCARCNNEWMSGLSGKVKDRFRHAILDGEPISLGAKDAAILAAFTFMKSVVTNHLTDQKSGCGLFFTRAVRERFRTSLTLPPLLKCWIAGFQGKAYMSTRNNLSIMSTSEPGPLSGIEFYSFTYVVGKLAVQLLVPRWKHLLDSGKPLVSLNPNAFWADAEALFWPHPGGFISWPLPMYIGDDTIQKYIYRFNNPVTVTVVRGTQVFSNIAT